MGNGGSIITPTSLEEPKTQKTESILTFSGNTSSFDQKERGGSNDMFRSFECFGPFKEEQEFQVLEEIHDGKSSKIFCVYTTNGTTNKVFAMKKISKEKSMNLNISKYVCRESKIMRSLSSSPFICTFVSSFKSEAFLYIIMKYYKMDLAEAIEKYDFKLPEEEAQRIGAQIFLALKYLHSKNMMYRDLKPENVLVENDINFRVALSDFGYVKISRSKRTNSLIGNIENFSPEVIDVGIGEKMHYGFSTDWWSFGVFLYEIVCAKHPFYRYDLHGKELDHQSGRILRMIQRFQPEQLKFPSHVSRSFKDLVKKLLIKDPTKRLGYVDEDEIRNHKWFEKVPWFEFCDEDEEARFFKNGKHNCSIL